MSISLISTLLWLHVLAMVGSVGALLAVQFVLPRETRNDPAVARRGARLLNTLLAAGFLAGLGAFVVKLRAFKAAGIDFSSAYHALIGTKFLLLLAAGAVLGVASARVRKDRAGAAHTLRTVALVLLVAAAFLGSLLTN